MDCPALLLAALPLFMPSYLIWLVPLKMHALSVGGVYYVLKSGLIQSFHTWFVDLFGMIVYEV